MIDVVVEDIAAVALLDHVVHNLADMRPALKQAVVEVYARTREHMDAWGQDASSMLFAWPPLAASTVASKEAANYPDPTRPLYATGDLYDSATSPDGPYSFQIITQHQAVVGIDWDEDGWQIPYLHQYGTTRGGGSLPARPIFIIDDRLEGQVKQILGDAIIRIR
ncbi:MAG TPA: hypothetical protein VFF79_12810 [Conexibacter sp.]|jgi:hypothetical protein|nr:hypothetical protein [Conexibacter sp.]